MAFDFSSLNSASKKTVRDGISTKELPDAKLAEYEGKELIVDGFFINTGKKGDWVVVIADGKKISMPSQYTDQFKAIKDNAEALADVLAGKLKLTNIRPYETKAGNKTYLVDFASV